MAIAACGQDFYWNTVSARSLSLGGTFVPGPFGVSDALAANPAGLGALLRPTMEMNAVGFFTRGNFSNAANRNAPMILAPAFLPFGSFAAPLGSTGFRVALGIVPELTAVSQWNYVDAPGTAGVSYGEQKHKSAIVSVRLAGGIAYTFSPRLTVGATVARVYNANQLVAPYIFQSHPALSGLKTLLDLTTIGYGWNYSLGVLARPHRSFELGASWKSATTIDSRGRATGNVGAQLAALGISNFAPDFRYQALVRNTLPQSALLHGAIQATPRMLLVFQGSWTGWSGAFQGLPVQLTNGTNADLNRLLSSNALSDRIPLNWRNRFTISTGAEYALGEALRLRGGFSSGTNPVPAATLNPLTAAIARHQLTGGLGWRRNRWSLDFAYAFGLPSTVRVGNSALLAGEYSRSTTRIGVQHVSLTFAYTL
jgi:long-chain fatty acid transport protein